MSLINGLPAHPLLVHFIVVLALLTAALAVLCAVWPAARQRLVWLVLALAVATVGLTPLTTDSGEWLQNHVEKSEMLEKHAEMGDTMIYFSLALLVAAVLLVVAHRRTLTTALSGVIAVFVIAASVATGVQIYRIGDSGAKSVWSDALTTTSAGEKPGE